MDPARRGHRRCKTRRTGSPGLPQVSGETELMDSQTQNGPVQSGRVQSGQVQFDQAQNGEVQSGRTLNGPAAIGGMRIDGSQVDGNMEVGTSRQDGSMGEQNVLAPLPGASREEDHSVLSFHASDHDAKPGRPGSANSGFPNSAGTGPPAHTSPGGSTQISLERASTRRAVAANHQSAASRSDRSADHAQMAPMDSSVPEASLPGAGLPREWGEGRRGSRFSAFVPGAGKGRTFGFAASLAGWFGSLLDRIGDRSNACNRRLNIGASDDLQPMRSATLHQATAIAADAPAVPASRVDTHSPQERHGARPRAMEVSNRLLPGITMALADQVRCSTPDPGELHRAARSSRTTGETPGLGFFSFFMKEPGMSGPALFEPVRHAPGWLDGSAKVRAGFSGLIHRWISDEDDGLASRGRPNEGRESTKEVYGMSWRGRLTLTFLMVSVALGLGLANFAGAAPLPPGNNLGALSAFRLPDGMPRSAGPSIVDATYRQITGGSPAAANDSLWVIFSEPINFATFATSDLRFRNGAAPALTYTVAVPSGPNMVALTGFNRTIAAGDSIYLAGAGVLAGTDGSTNLDVSHINIRTGPAIFWVEFRPGGALTFDMRPNTDTLRVYLTHNYLSGINTANPRDDFDMPEFGEAAVPLAANAVVGRRFVDILFGTGASADDRSVNAHGKVLALVSKIKIRTTAGISGNHPADTAGDITSATFHPWHIVDALRTTGTGTTNLGPTLIAAGYNTRAAGAADDVLTLVFDRDLDPSTVDAADFAFAGAVLGSDDGDNIVTMTDFTTGGALTPGVSTVALGAGVVSDYSGRANPAQPAVPIDASPIIIVARYNDGGDADPVNDILDIFFDTPVIGSNADTTDFDYYGFTSNSLIVTETADNDSLITMTGFSAGNTWEQGDRIGLRTGGNMRSAPGVNGGNDAFASDTGLDASRFVRDFSQPRLIHFAQNLTYSRDTQGPISATADTAFVAVDERDVDDAAYFAMWVRKNSAVNLSYIQSTFNNATYITDPNPGTPGLDRNLIMTHDITPLVGQASDGQFINTGDVVNFAIYAVDRDGNVALNTTSNILVGSFIAGPIPAPRDHDCVAGVAVNPTTTDTDMIHVIGTRTANTLVTTFPVQYAMFGDAGSAIGADSIHVYEDAGLTSLVGAGAANKATGSWATLLLNFSAPPTTNLLYVTAVQVVGGTSSESSPTPILFDRLLFDNIYAGSVRDPLNGLRRYTPGDTVHILAFASDTTGGGAPAPGSLNPKGANGVVSGFRSDLMALSANFTGFSTRAGSDSVVFISLGANKNDEDNDWVDNGATAYNNTVLAGNNAKDYPEPYVDENGNGIYDCGETFADYTGGAYTAKIHDEGDSNLDSNDDNEHSWYYLEYWIDPNTATLVADPNGGDNFATLEDVNIPLELSDNAILSQAALDELSDELAGQANRSTMSFETNLNLAHNTGQANLTPSGDPLFEATLDALAPTVSEISYLAKSNVASVFDAPPVYPAGNIITPGNNVYELPSGVATPYINFVDSTLSDDDVMFTAVQFDTTANTSTSQTEGGWRYLSFDPPGDRGTSSHNDGLPGIALLDDDYDSTAAKANGLDDDEDGDVDEDGEGVDLSDRQVFDATQQPWDDANSDAPDGVYRRNDGIDNDNDAFFRYNPFLNTVIWFNVDESDSNGVDDDGDGTVDNATEIETYNAAFDDDEDGMQDGTVTAINLGASDGTIAQLTGGTLGAGGTIFVRAFEDPATVARYRGSKNTKPTATGITGATPGSWLSSYLDESTGGGTAAVQYGQLFNSNTLGRDDLATEERAHGSRNIMSSIGFTDATAGAIPWFRAVLNTGSDFDRFNWNFYNLTGRNLDLSRVQRLYDLVDGSEYRMRVVAVDQAFNHNPAWAVPVRFTLDSTAPVVCIPPAHRSATPGTGTAPEFNDIVDVRPGTPGLQLLDKGGHPGPYTLRADVVLGDDIKEVHFQYFRTSTQTWVDLPATPANPDGSAPYTLFWDAPLLGNSPAALADTVYFRAYAVDNQGNTEDQFLLNDPPTLANGPQVDTCVDDDRLWELQVIVIDGTEPSSCVCQVGSDYDLTDGAQVPVEQAVDVSAWFTDNDGVVGTNDVINVRFEYTPIGANTWTPFASLTGVPTSGELRDPSGIIHPVLVTGPDTLKTTVTWDTRLLAAGSYEIRAVATDIEGNSSVLTACVFTVTLDNSALRAYIQPVVLGSNSDTCGVAATDTLYAQVFIHDRSVAVVEFQYYADTNDNGLADDGGSWVTIFTQGDDASERKGDVTLRASDVPFKDAVAGGHLPLLAFGGTLRYWDPDNNGYSSIDAIVADLNGNGIYEPNLGEYRLAGNAAPPTGATLRNFEPNEYMMDLPPYSVWPPLDYIMQDNPLNTGAEQTDVWRALWDVTGLSGKYLVRAVARDNLGNTDSDLEGSPIPVAEVVIDSELPSAVVTSITLQDNTSFNIPPQGQYISAANSFFYVNATTEDTDIMKVLFQWSRDGGVTWNTLDVNDDQDMYSDLNMDWVFTEGPDEIFVDANGNGRYDSGDIVLSKGDNGVIDTPTDASNPYSALFPLVSEDSNDGDDNDGDGKTDEDGTAAVSTLGGQSPHDYFAPYSVPFLFHNLTFATETNVLFRAVATDNNNNVDCDPAISSVVVGDNVAPETDVVKAVVNGDTLDIETVLRGTLDASCLDTLTVGQMTLLVTAEDQAQITSVDIYYRRDPAYYTSYDEWETYLAWTPIGAADTAYPYEFAWDIQNLEDGVYQFYARATDANGNVTRPPQHPYRFSIMRTTATVTAANLLGSGISATEVRPGDVVVLSAAIDPSTSVGSTAFYYAERVENEPITTISTTYPFITGELQRSMTPSAGNGADEVVTIGGQPGIFVPASLWSSTTGKTSLHYTVRNGGSQLEFGAAITSGTVVTVSYNVTAWSFIEDDEIAPFTVEWEVPNVTPSNAGVTTHFDIQARFTANIPGGEVEYCTERSVSEGFNLRVIDTEIPRFTVYGIDDVNNNGSISQSDDNWPGNSLCVSVGLDEENDDIGQEINKLSGDWADFFLTSNELLATGDDDFATVSMTVTSSGGFSQTCDFTKNPIQNDPPQDVHKVLYLSDFPTLDPARVENVTITVSGFADAPSARTYDMYDDGATGGDLVAGDGHYTITLSLPPATSGSIDYEYEFTIDLVGNDFIETEDPRNDDDGDSIITIPALPYWFCSARRLDDGSLFQVNDVNHVVVTVTDNEGNVGTNISTVGTSLVNQGQIDVIVDRTAPSVVSITTDRPAVKVGGEVKVFATIVDPTPADINIIAIPSVLFQVSPNTSRSVWLNWQTDSNPEDGWGGVYGWGYDPLNDDIDNDEDGLFDEADESEFVYWIRVSPVDDCFNRGYSNLQTPAVVQPITVDHQAPVCEIASPINGEIFAHGSTISITAAPSSDTDVIYVSFQYDAGDGWRAIDATPGNDLDDVDGFEGTETPAFAVNGVYSVTWNTSFLDQADMYIRIRCVGRDRAGNWSGNLEDAFDAPGAPVIEYVTILLNDTTAPFAALTHVVGDGLAYVDKAVVDPTLAIKGQVILTGVASGYVAPNDLNGDVATVLLQYSTDGTNWTDAGVTNQLDGIGPLQYRFGFVFDTRALGLADGFVWVRTAAMDHDGNLQGDTNKDGILQSTETVNGAIRILVDNSAPAMWLTMVGPVAGSPVADHTLIVADLWPREIARGGQFEVDDTSLRLSDNVSFKATAPSGGNSVDIINYTFLQFLDDFTDQENPRWQPSFPTIPWMDADHNGTVDSAELSAWYDNREDYIDAVEDFQDDAEDMMFSYRDNAGNPTTSPDGNWWLEFSSVADLKNNMNPFFDAPGALSPKGAEGPISFLPDKEYRYRAVTVDYAGNSNLDYQGHILRIDSINPTIVDIYAGNTEIEAGGGGDNQVTQNTVHVAGGDTVPLAAYINDDYGFFGDGKGVELDRTKLGAEGFDPDLPGTISESAGVLGVRFDYRSMAFEPSAASTATGATVEKGLQPTAAGEVLFSGWTIIGLGTFDAAAALWKIDWITPKNLSHTGPQAGNGSSTTDSLYAIRAVAVDSAGNYSSSTREAAVAVQDITPPDETEIVDINGTNGGATYPPQTTEETVNTTRGTWVARSVDLVAATQANDPSMIGGNSFVSDVFAPTVYFEAKRRGTETWVLIGTTQSSSFSSALAHQGPVWSVVWNTMQLNGEGARIWADGQYDVRAWGRDAWGNTEVLTGGDSPKTVLVTIDNAAPQARVDANPSTTQRETEATIERNSKTGYTFLVNTYNGDTITTDEDVVVYYYYKLSTDLNVASSWKAVGPGKDASDVNPDQNRPFMFDWDTWQISGCASGDLVPGLTYDIAADVTDLLGNRLGVVSMHDAGFSSRLIVTDTIAPKATITELVRNVGNSNPVEFPNSAVRIRSVSYIQATVSINTSSTGDDAARDAESVQFYYRPQGTTAWILADGDISAVGDQTWRLTNWDMSQLAEGLYEFAAVATDCYGNTDANPAFVTLRLDRTSPVYAGVNPINDQKLVPDETPDTVPPCTQPSTRSIDLIVRQTDDNDTDYTTFSNNSFTFQYKRSETADREENWSNASGNELKDNGPSVPSRPTFASAFNIRNLPDGLYDFRVDAQDVAGNVTHQVFAQKTVVDNTLPVVEITAIQFPNRTDLTVQPVNGGVLPDISAGEVVKIYVTAHDDESVLPNDTTTGRDLTDIFEVQFFLVSGPDGNVTTPGGTYPQLLGTAGFDATRGQYYINWNTTGLPDGQFQIVAMAQDDVRNVNCSQTVTGDVTNPAKPYAQVTAFNPDLLSEITKGTNSRVYATTFGEKLASTVFFQYQSQKPGEAAYSEWINIGTALNTGETLSTRELGLLTQTLWMSNMRISDLPENTNLKFRSVAVGSTSVDSLEVLGGRVQTVTAREAGYYGRAAAGKGLQPTDGEPGDFSGLYDLPNTPTITMVKKTSNTGQARLDFVPNAANNLITGVEAKGVDFVANGLISVSTSAPNVYPFVTLVAEDNTGAIDEALPEMNRRLDDPTVWTGDIIGSISNFTGVDPTEGARITMFASSHLKRASEAALTPQVDMKWHTWYIHQLRHNAGSNGVAGIDGRGFKAADGYPTDDFAVDVPPGAVTSNVGMLLTETYRPVMNATQDLYISAFGPTYSLNFITYPNEDGDPWGDNYPCQNDGWQAKGWIRYDDADPAIREGEESRVTVVAWTPSSSTSGSNQGQWRGDGISNVVVDTENDVVTFNFEPCDMYAGDHIIFSLVATDRFSPVSIDTFPFWRGTTDQDPIFKILLTNVTGGDIDQSDIQVYHNWFDEEGNRQQELVAQTGRSESGNGDGGYTNNVSYWVKYRNMWFDLDTVDGDGRRLAITMGWPCDNDFGLKEGRHELEVWFRSGDASQYYGVDQPWAFEVDRTPVEIKLDGGFVGDPVQQFAPAYVGSESNAITVRLVDKGAGVLFREDRIDDDDFSHWWWNDIEDECKIARFDLLYDEWFYENEIPIQFDADNSFKYDLWRVNNPDHNSQPNAVHTEEERTLLHTGTADEVWPNVRTSADGDTLWVPLYILGGGQIADGNVLELTVYSKRYETQPINFLNENLDQISGQGGLYGSGWWIDFSTKRFIQYAAGIQDHVCNVGSRFVEQRYIVDKSAPTVSVTSTGVSCDGSQVEPVELGADQDYQFTADFADGDYGSGVKVSTVQVTVTGPGGSEVAMTNKVVTAEGVSFTLLHPVSVGQYQIRITGQDYLGNAFSKTCVLYVGSGKLDVTAATAYPNPFNPKASDMTFSFVNNRAADVTITVYDFNGDKVKTIRPGNLGVGAQTIKWGGDAEDGTPLANGVYLARIEANDGRRTETQTLKVAIWRD